MQDHSATVLARFTTPETLDVRHTVAARYRVHVDAITLPQLGRIKTDLTLSPKVYDADAAPNTFDVWQYDGESRIVEVPRYYGLATLGVPTGDSDCRTLGLPFPNEVRFCGTLRAPPAPPQAAIVASALTVLRGPGGGILQLGCGSGKTACALAIAAALGRRTAILVHNGKTLLPQILSAIAKFLPGARTGIVRSGVNNLADHNVDIVVCVIQSLIRRRYDPAVMDTVGTVIVDECHHVGARVYAQCMGQFRARYTLGLSATPDRKDGLRPYVEWLLGPVIVSLPTDFSRVHVIRYTYPDTRVRAHANRKNHCQRSYMLDDAIRDFSRTSLLLRFVLNLVKETDRTVLAVTERVAQVDAFADYLTQSGFGGGVARLHGKVPSEQVALAQCARVIVATYPLANEALDIPHADTLVCLTPIVGFIEQDVGRIVRMAYDKRVPLVVDFVDPVGLFAGMARTRRKWYAKVGVAGIVECTVRQSALVKPDEYAVAKPCAVAPQWVAAPDPWNLRDQ